MVLHVDGTTPPGTPPRPENLKAHVYFPPNLLNEFKDSHESIAHIVQSFIENIGVPTVMRWRRAVTSLGWKLRDQSESTRTPLHLPLIPDATFPSSAHYVFTGRPYGSFETATSTVSHLSSPFSEHAEPSPLLDHVAWAVEVDSLRHNLQASQSRVTELEATVTQLQGQIDRILTLRERRANGAAATSTPNGFPHPQLPTAQPTLSRQVFFADSHSPTPSIVTRKIQATPVANERSSSLARGTSAPKPSLHVSFAKPSFPKPDMAGGIRPFGAFCHAFFLAHGMDQRFHEQIRNLYESLPHEKWQLEIMSWFGDEEDEDAACLLAGWLYIDMCADARTLEQISPL